MPGNSYFHQSSKVASHSNLAIQDPEWCVVQVESDDLEKCDPVAFGSGTLLASKDKITADGLVIKDSTGKLIERLQSSLFCKANSHGEYNIGIM